MRRLRMRLLMALLLLVYHLNFWSAVAYASAAVRVLISSPSKRFLGALQRLHLSLSSKILLWTYCYLTSGLPVVRWMQVCWYITSCAVLTVPQYRTFSSVTPVKR